MTGALAIAFTAGEGIGLAAVVDHDCDVWREVQGERVEVTLRPCGRCTARPR